MANYITLDGYQYYVTGRKYKTPRKKSQKVGVTLTGKTISRSFSFIDRKFKPMILVPRSASGAWGSLTELRAAYAKTSVSYTDQLGETVTVYMLGELPEPHDDTVLDDEMPMKIDLELRLVQT